jgi:hypothetical protein
MTSPKNRHGDGTGGWHPRTTPLRETSPPRISGERASHVVDHGDRGARPRPQGEAMRQLKTWQLTAAAMAFFVAGPALAQV